MTSALGLGGESALYRRTDHAVEVILDALKWGINYFDTAPAYEDSELNLGEVLPARRAEMFIATKTDQRGYDAAWRQFERSLTRLRVDKVDLLQLHHLGEMEDIERVFSHDGALRMLWEAKEQGLTRFIGVTGHRDPKVLLSAIESFDFDTILMALNPAEVHIRSFQDKLLPRALEKGMGVMAMKVLARGLLHDLAGIKVPDAIGYALTLPVSNVVLGVMGLGQLQRDAQIVNAFRPMNRAKMAELEAKTEYDAARINFYRRGGKGDFPTPETMERRPL
jgi:aryl-alcohol dehydrogenase-like predicted oxidoreductase